jgi:hypothetical protein
MLIKTETGTQDVPLMDAITGVMNVNAGNYIVPAGEERLYHVIQELKKFNPETGKRLSRPCVQKYGKKEYETIVQRQLRLQGYTVEVLHEPTGDDKASVDNGVKIEGGAQVKALRDELNALRAELAAMKAKKKPQAKKPSKPKVEAQKDEENKD